jgi:penicillin-binding protein 1B
MFPSNGIASRPNWVRTIRDRNGSSVHEQKVERHEVLDPRVNYLMVNMMEDVMRAGTAASSRSRGFVLPAGGKTGSSRDGWFAGFTSKLVCVVWVGFDDNRDIKLEGAKSALPIWTEFMKRAHQHREYKGVLGFNPPEGVVSTEVDVASGKLGSGKTEVYIAGTQPVEGVGGATQVFSWDTSDDKKGEDVPSPASSAASSGPRTVAMKRSEAKAGQSSERPVASEESKAKAEEKKGLWGRIRSIFK